MTYPLESTRAAVCVCVRETRVNETQFHRIAISGGIACMFFCMCPSLQLQLPPIPPYVMQMGAACRVSHVRKLFRDSNTYCICMTENRKGRTERRARNVIILYISNISFVDVLTHRRRVFAQKISFSMNLFHHVIIGTCALPRPHTHPHHLLRQSQLI